MDKLKYSDLLLLGSKQVKQCTKWYFDHNRTVTEACAIGMMTIAKMGSLDGDILEHEASELDDTMAQLPDPTGRKNNLSMLITSLNDDEAKTPEQIAEILKQHGY